MGKQKPGERIILLVEDNPDDEHFSRRAFAKCCTEFGWSSAASAKSNLRGGRSLIFPKFEARSEAAGSSDPGGRSTFRSASAVVAEGYVHKEISVLVGRRFSSKARMSGGRSGD